MHQRTWFNAVSFDHYLFFCFEQTFELLQDKVNFPRLVNRALGSEVRIPFIPDSPRKRKTKFDVFISHVYSQKT